MLNIKNLHVKLEEEDKQILKGVDLTVEAGKVHAIMGPNGSGKSTLSYVLSGRDGYEVTEGSATLLGEDLLEMEPEERAAAGLFLAFQYPVEIPGVGNMTFLRTALNAQRKARGEEEMSARRLPQAHPRQGEGPADRRRHAEAARQRGLLRRREEAQRDPADGASGAEDVHPRRDRFRPRRGRDEAGVARRERAARRGARVPRHHPLPAAARPYRSPMSCTSCPTGAS
jgi:Fe-S cluster assembly ATPase SufC